MFSSGLQFLTVFSKRDEGELSIGHCLAVAAVAVVVLVSIMSISPDIDRIYGGQTTVTGAQMRPVEVASEFKQPNPGIFAHVSQR